MTSTDVSIHPRVPLQLPTVAALALLILFAAIGRWLDGPQGGWVFAACLGVGALVAAVLVRPVGLWVVVPAPPFVLLGLVVGTVWWQQSFALGGKRELLAAIAPQFIPGFPSLVIAMVAALCVALFRTVKRGVRTSRGDQGALGTGAGIDAHRAGR